MKTSEVDCSSSPGLLTTLGTPPYVTWCAWNVTAPGTQPAVLIALMHASANYRPTLGTCTLGLLPTWAAWTGRTEHRVSLPYPKCSLHLALPEVLRAGVQPSPAFPSAPSAPSKDFYLLHPHRSSFLKNFPSSPKGKTRKNIVS